MHISNCAPICLVAFYWLITQISLVSLILVTGMVICCHCGKITGSPRSLLAYPHYRALLDLTSVLKYPFSTTT